MAPGVAAPTRGRVGRASDEALLAAAREGSDEAFLALYDRYRDLAWRVARSVAPNDLDAEDAVAEAFSRIYAAVAEREIASFRSYLAASVRNTAIDVYRRRERPVDEEELHYDLERSGRSAVSVEERVVDLDDRSLVAQAFESLPERHRVAIWISEVEGFSTVEAGDVLGTTANGAAALTMRARERLRTAYLQAHLQAADDPECAGTVADLGSHLRGGLSRRATRKLETHLEGCSTCGDRLTELRTLNETLAAAIPAAPVGLLTGEQVLDSIQAGGLPFPDIGGAGGATGGRWADHLGGLSDLTTRALPYAPASPSASEHILSPVAAAVAGLLVAGIAMSGAPAIDRDPGLAERPASEGPAFVTPGGSFADARSSEDPHDRADAVEIDAEPAANRTDADGSGVGSGDTEAEGDDASAEDVLRRVGDNVPHLPDEGGESEGGDEDDDGPGALLGEVERGLNGVDGGSDGSEAVPSDPTGVDTVDTIAEDVADEVERVDGELSDNEEEDGENNEEPDESAGEASDSNDTSVLTGA